MRARLLLVAIAFAGCSVLYDVDTLVDEPRTDAGDGVDAGDPPDAAESTDAADAPDAADTPDAADAPDASEPVDAGETIDAGDAPDAGTPVLEETCVASGWCRQWPEIRNEFNNPDTIGALYAVTGTSDNAVWAAGQNAQVLHWNGTRWSQESRGFGYVNALWIDPSGHGIAVGHDGAQQALIRRRAPNGTWTTDTLPSGRALNNLTSVWGRVVGGQVQAWVVGGTNEYWKLSGGAWSVHYILTGAVAQAVWGVPEAGGVRAVFGSYSGITALSPDDVEDAEHAGNGPNVLWGSSDGAIWGTSGPNLFERVGGGASWAVETVPGSGNRSTRGVCGRAGGPLLVVSQDLPTGAPGSTGAMRRYNPVDDSFTSLAIPATEFIEACWMAPNGEAWAVGSEGLQPPTGILLHHPNVAP